jgi:hypothetical protein
VDVFGRKHNIELAVLLDDVAFANRAGDDFQSCFPDILARDRAWQGCPWELSGAVSGCNILILCFEASVLRPDKAIG